MATKTKTFTADLIIPQKFGKLVDNFDDNSLDTSKWNKLTAGTQIAEQNRRLEFVFSASPVATELELRSTDKYDLINNVVKFQYVSDLGFSSLSHQTLLRLFGTSGAGLSVQILSNSIAGYYNTGSGDTLLFSIAYSNSNHKWIRFRHTVNTIYIETSPEGLNWTPQGSHADFNGLGGMFFYIYERNETAIASTSYIDDFNVNTSSFIVDGFITDLTGGYLLDGIKLKRPKQMNREFIYQKTDYTAITGKLSRDISAKKEKFILTYDNLTKAQVDLLMTIISQNEPVSWIVSPLGINTVVWPYIGSIVYETVGGDYRAGLVLELIEEQ